MTSAVPDTMQAAWYETFGAARDVLHVTEWPVPMPAAGEVLVEVKASGLNPHDVKKRSGWMGGKLNAPRVIPHGDAAGIVVAVGEGLREHAVGDRVWVWGAGYRRPGEGTAAGYVAVCEDQAVALPDHLTFAQGACLGVPTFTAYYALLADGPVTGQDVLVQGGAGAVGSVAIEMARWNGARVIATVSSEEKAQIALAAGADHVVDYKRENAAQRVLEITRGRGVDRIVEVDFGDNIAMNAKVLKANGTLASYSSTRSREPVFRYYDFAIRGCRIHLVQAMTMPSDIRRRATVVISALLERRFLTPRIAETFPLARIAESHELLESGKALGNIVVEP